MAKGSARDLIKLIERKAPEYLDLLTAKTDEEFENAFDAILGHGVAYIEENKKFFKELDEEGLSSVLVAKLSIPGLTVSREKNSNGHVDITIEADHSSPVRKKLGEAKIYRGPEYHYTGLEQLLGRYTTGREGRGLLVAFCRQKNIAGLFASLRQRMDVDLPSDQQGPTINHSAKWQFLSLHLHSSGEKVEVGHVGCNVCNE